MKAERDSELVSPCGMNCALCSGYLAFKNDVRRNDIRMPYCTGCRPRNKNCAFLKKHCSKLQNGEVTFCFECTSFPCERLKTIDNRYKSRYRMSMIENLSFIKDNGIEKFLKEQNETWKCKTCGHTVEWSYEDLAHRGVPVCGQPENLSPGRPLRPGDSARPDPSPRAQRVPPGRH
jgi:hypothetical protein